MTAVEAYSRLAGIYDEIVVDPCYDRWATFLHELWHSEDAGVHAVLDVCCGTGLMAQVLVARGYRVVGVDGSAPMLSRLVSGRNTLRATEPVEPVARNTSARDPEPRRRTSRCRLQ